jgi:hypothetical protein
MSRHGMTMSRSDETLHIIAHAIHIQKKAFTGQRARQVRPQDLGFRRQLDGGAMIGGLEWE